MDPQKTSEETKLANLVEMQVELTRLIKISEKSAEPFLAYMLEMALIAINEKLSGLSEHAHPENCQNLH